MRTPGRTAAGARTAASGSLRIVVMSWGRDAVVGRSALATGPAPGSFESYARSYVYRDTAPDGTGADGIPPAATALGPFRKPADGWGVSPDEDVGSSQRTFTYRAAYPGDRAFMEWDKVQPGEVIFGVAEGQLREAGAVDGTLPLSHRPHLDQCIMPLHAVNRRLADEHNRCLRILSGAAGMADLKRTAAAGGASAELTMAELNAMRAAMPTDDAMAALVSSPALRRAVRSVEPAGPGARPSAAITAAFLADQPANVAPDDDRVLALTGSLKVAMHPPFRSYWPVIVAHTYRMLGLAESIVPTHFTGDERSRAALNQAMVNVIAEGHADVALDVFNVGMQPVPAQGWWLSLRRVAHDGGDGAAALVGPLEFFPHAESTLIGMSTAPLWSRFPEPAWSDPRAAAPAAAHAASEMVLGTPYNIRVGTVRPQQGRYEQHSTDREGGTARAAAGASAGIVAPQPANPPSNVPSQDDVVRAAVAVNQSALIVG